MHVKKHANGHLIKNGSGNLSKCCCSVFTIKVKTDNPGTSATNQFSLPLRRGGHGYDFTAYYDGTSTYVYYASISGTDPLITLTFPSGPGTYSIEIVGLFPAIYFNYSNDRRKILEIEQWGSGAWATFFGAYSGCTNLTIPATDLPNTGSVTDFNSAWYECTSLTSFPLIDTSSGTDFRFTWNYCTGLTSFPLIDTSSGTNFGWTWSGCTGLTSFPLIDTSAGTLFNETWYECSGLTSFPALDTGLGTSFYWCWADCTGLTSFSLTKTGSANDFEWTWRGCTGLTSFPLIDTSSGTWFYGTWDECSGLTSFPLIDTSNGLFFSDTWADCSGLNGYDFPTLNFSKLTHGSLFYGVQISTAAWSNILIFISANNTNVGEFLGGGTSKYNAAGKVARDELTGRSPAWTISDGGLE